MANMMARTTAATLLGVSGIIARKNGCSWNAEKKTWVVSAASAGLSSEKARGRISDGV